MLATKWTVWVEVAHPDGTSERHEVESVQRDLSSPGPADFGLTTSLNPYHGHRFPAEVIEHAV